MLQDISPANHLLLQKHKHLLKYLLKYASPMKMCQKLWAMSLIALGTYVWTTKWIPEESGELFG